MRTTLAAITLVLVMGVSATVAMAQAVTEKSSGKVQEQLQNAGAKVLVVSIQDMDLSDEQEGGDCGDPQRIQTQD